jgi:hypothetical protein
MIPEERERHPARVLGVGVRVKAVYIGRSPCEGVKLKRQAPALLTKLSADPATAERLTYRTERPRE